MNFRRSNKLKAVGVYICTDCGAALDKPKTGRPVCRCGGSVTYFHSQKEWKVWRELRLRERAGEISALQIHPTFSLVVNGRKCGKYSADFAFRENGQARVWDVKGFTNHRSAREANLRIAVAEALHGISVEIV